MLREVYSWRSCELCFLLFTITTWDHLPQSMPRLIFRQKISLMITSSSKTVLIFSWHVDVDMRQELMKLRVSFDKSGIPDPLISQTPRRVIYAFFVSSRTQFVLPCTVACYILIWSRARSSFSDAGVKNLTFLRVWADADCFFASIISRLKELTEKEQNNKRKIGNNI